MPPCYLYSIMRSLVIGASESNVLGPEKGSAQFGNRDYAAIVAISAISFVRIVAWRASICN